MKESYGNKIRSVIFRTTVQNKQLNLISIQNRNVYIAIKIIAFTNRIRFAKQIDKRSESL